MKVSVIIPNYNHSNFLTQRIESVLNQTYKDFEVIILDDCSTDNSRNIIEKFIGHEKVSQIVYNKSNSGSVFNQWAKGLSLAKGEYVWIAESDDYASSNFLESLVPLLDQNPNVGIVYCDSQIVNHQNEFIGEFSKIKNSLFKTERWNKQYTNNGLGEIKNYLSKSCTINNASAVIIRKKNFRDMQGISYKYFGDLFMYISILRNSDVSYIPDKLNFYREHDGNASKKGDKDGILMKETIDIYNFLLKKISFNIYEKHLLAKEAAAKFSENEIIAGNNLLSEINDLQVRVLSKLYYKIFQRRLVKRG